MCIAIYITYSNITTVSIYGRPIIICQSGNFYHWQKYEYFQLSLLYRAVTSACGSKGERPGMMVFKGGTTLQ